MKANTWMKFYVGDYLRDTGHLSVTEHGAYLLLLMHAWTHDGVLKNDEVRLRIVAKMSIKEWKRSSHTLRAFFFPDGDYLRHRRIDRELAETDRLTTQRSAAGKASAAARKGQHKLNGKANGNSTGVEPPLKFRSVESELEKEKERIPPKGSRPTPARSAPLEGGFEVFWKLYPRKQEGPAACRKEWDRALKVASAEEIISGLRRYPFKPDFLPMAATWLNQKRWLTQANTPPPLVLSDHDPTFSPGQL